MHVPQRQRALQLSALRTGLNKLTTTMINFSVGHAQTSSILHPSAYQIPRQYLYSRGGGQQPTFIPSLHPQQGNTHCGHYPILPHFHQKRSLGVWVILLPYTNVYCDSISKKVATKFCSFNLWDFFHVIIT